MRVVSARQILLLATAAVSVGWAQPTITSLQSSQINSPAQNVTGVTSGTASLGNGFALYINGTFQPASFLNVKWLNTSTNVTTTFNANIQVSTTQISLIVPFALFSTPVANPVPVTVTVTETGGTSSATYTINPPLQAVGPILPSGTLNHSYTTSVIFGGTAPFDPGIPTTGTLPPGLIPQLDATLIGTPTQTGVFNFQDFITDFWGNAVQGDDTIEIVDVPTVTSLVPNSSGSGAGNLTIAVNGTNFVNQVAVGAAAIPGSKVSWVGSVVTPLATTFVNANLLTAVVPSALLATPGSAAVTVTQPSTVSSTVGPSAAFSILPPSISSISPPSAPVGSSSTTITVHGANFVVGATSGSTVSLNNTALATTFVDTATLTALIPSSMLTAPGLFIVRVTNPGGTVSSPATFSVLAAVLSSISPNALPVGSGNFTLVASGASFVSGSQILFNGTALSTVLLSNTSLSATVPGSLINRAGQFDVRVQNPGGSGTPPQIFSVLSPAITSISPTSIAAGAATFTLTVNGNNFAAGAQVSFDGNALTTTTGGGPSALLATVPAPLVAGPKVASIVVTNPGLSGNVSGSASFTVIGSLSIVTTSIPSGTAGTNYSATFTGQGGTPPYSWSATGIPVGLSLNPTTGVLSGVNPSGGTFTLSVVLQDAARATATAPFQLVLAPPPPPPVSISASTNLPGGTVGITYQGFVFANGGVEPYTFSLGSGSLPDGLTLLSTGGVFGTPKTPGQFSFTVVVTDSKGGTASGGFSITIKPAPLGVTGGPPTSSVPAGSPITITFTGTGGVPPYRYTACGAPPPGTSFNNGVFSGTLTTPGTFTTCVTVADTTGAVATKSAPLIVAEAPPAPLSVGGTVGPGKVGVSYSAQLTASGGTGPYTFSGSGLPDGLSLSTSGAISGTPATAGQFSLSATVTDSKGGTGGGTFPIAIAPATLSIVTASLPDGTVGVAYSANLTAAGGFPPYTWSISGLPDGVSATPAGVISGTPTTAGKFTVGVVVKDGAPGSIAPSTSYTVTISSALAITTATAPNGTVGTPYTASFAASGGTTPLTFSATGLPAGLSMSTTGTISGTPTAPGPATIVVTVKDAGGTSTSKNYPVTIALPPAPPLIFSGAPATAPPLQQPRIQVSLGNPFPLDVVVTLTLTFAPDSGPDDPTIQFSSGGRVARITVPAGSLNGSTDVGVQIGSVAGLITIVSQMQSGGQDVTPSPAPRTTIRIAPAAPVIVTGSLTAVRNSTGFTVTLTGYVTDRELTQAIFQFTAAAGGNLQTTTLTVPIDTIFAAYFSSAGAAATGSQFTYTQPFTVTGSTQAIVSVTVTLVNKIGQSAPATATLN